MATNDKSVAEFRTLVSQIEALRTHAVGAPTSEGTSKSERAQNTEALAFSTGASVTENELRAQLKPLVRSLVEAAGMRKDFPTLVSRVSSDVTAWVAGLGPCSPHDDTTSGQLCPARQMSARLLEEGIVGHGVCDDFEIAVPAVEQFVATLGTSALREAVLRSLTEASLTVKDFVAGREARAVGLAQRLAEKSPMSRAELLTQLPNDATSSSLNEVALSTAIDSGWARDTAYWQLAKVRAHQGCYEEAVGLVDAGMSHLTGLSEMRRMRNKAKRWSKLGGQ